MYLYITLLQNSSVIDSVRRISDLSELSQNEKKHGLIVESEEEIIGDCICVIDISTRGDKYEAAVYAYDNSFDAEDKFKVRAAEKFSNWE